MLIDILLVLILFICLYCHRNKILNFLSLLREKVIKKSSIEANTEKVAKG